METSVSDDLLTLFVDVMTTGAGVGWGFGGSASTGGRKQKNMYITYLYVQRVHILAITLYCRAVKLQW